MIKMLKCASNVETLDSLISCLRSAESGLDACNVVLVKENFSLTVEREILEKLDVCGYFSIDVLSFTRLMEKLSDKPASLEYISKFGAVMTVAGIIADRTKDFLCYKKRASGLGFAEKVYELIVELKGADITPEKLTSAIKRVPQYMAAKLHDVAIIYADYERTVSGEFFDETTKLDILTELIDTSPKIKNMSFFLTNFDGYTVRDYRVISHLAIHAKNVTFVTVTGNSSIYVNDSYESITTLLKDIGTAYEEVEIKSQRTAEAEVIADRMFSYMGGEKMATDNIDVFSADSVSEEIEHLAKNILCEVRKGARFKDFNVVCQDHDAYRLIIRKIFTRNNIPYFMGGGNGLSDHPAVGFLMAALYLKTMRNRPELSGFLSLAKNPMAGVDFEDACRFENYALKFGTGGEKLMHPLVYEHEHLPSAENVRLAVTSYLLLLDFPETARGGEYVRKIREFLDIIDFSGRLDVYSLSISQVNRQGAEFTAQVMDKLEGILSQIETIYGGRFLTDAEFLNLFKNGAAAIAVSLIPVGNDCVFIGSVNDAKFASPKYLSVIGAVDSLIPVVKRDWGLIAAREIPELEGAGIRLAALDYLNRRERLSCYLMLTNFREKLFVSYSRVSADGRSESQSRIVSYLTDMFESARSQDDCADAFYSLYAIERYLFTVRKESYDTVAATAYDVLRRRNAAETVDRYRRLAASSTVTERLSSAVPLFFGENTVSSTALETFYRCPFLYFADKGLGLKEREIFGMNSLDIGTYLHLVVERFSVKCGVLSGENEADALVERIVEEMHADRRFLHLLSSGSQKVVLGRLVREAKAVCREILRQYKTSRFKLKYHELAFGTAGSPAGITLCGNVSLNGKIDRVDVCGKLARVIDYKSGAVAPNLSGVYSGSKLQLGLYMKQVESMGFEPCGEFYFPLGYEYTDREEKNYRLRGRFIAEDHIIRDMDTDFDGSTSAVLPVAITKKNAISKTYADSALTKEGFAAVNDYSLKLAAKGVTCISSGFIEPKPIKDACKNCRVKNACGFDFSRNVARSCAPADIDTMIGALKNTDERREQE